MINNEENNIFSFINEESFISYKKVPLITYEIKQLKDTIIQKKNSFKPSFFYDKYTNQFIYINGEAIIILDSKCKIKAFSRITIEQKIKSLSVEYNNKYIVYTSYDFKSFIINLVDLDILDCFENKKVQYLDGFFIPHKRENKEHDYFILCMITRTYFNISRIVKRKNKYNSFDYSSKKTFLSNKMKIIDFNFNHIFKLLLIIKADPISFCLYNLKSKYCYKTPITIKNKILNKKDSKLYLQNIYNKLYLINLYNPFIEVYRLNNLNELKEPLKIPFNKEKNKKIKIKNISLQFYNNLIIVYMENFIKIYDIKSKINSHELFTLNLLNKEYFDFFYKARIYGKYLIVNDSFYKIKFLNLNYKKYSKSPLKDIFFTILRRRNTNQIIKNMLFEILNNLQISLFFEILEQIVVNNKKYNQKIRKRNSIKNNKAKEKKKDPYYIMYIGNNSFFLSEDYILGMFNQYFEKNIKPEIFLKILGNLYNIYSFHNIYLDINLYYSILFCFLNKIDNMNIIEYLIKNKIIPINKDLGNYFIIRAKRFNDLEKYKQCYNIGIDILMNENQYDEKLIEKISTELINNGDNSQAFNLLYDTFFDEFNKQKETNKH